MINTPNSMRLHIGIFGKTNAGKSSLINALADQEVAIVSDIKGTTTDLVIKAMELPGLGPVVIIDTPGFDDYSLLGTERIRLTEKALEKCDIAVFIFSGNLKEDIDFLDKIKEKKLKLITVVSKSDQTFEDGYLEKIEAYKPILISKYDQASIKKLIKSLSKLKEDEEPLITEGLCKKGDLVVLVMPQDASAPKGRLILPQVQTIRELLDKEVLVVSTGLATFEDSIKVLAKEPDLIITDSQCFKEVFEKKPKGVKLTSFSVLFSKLKGDIDYFVESAKILDKDFHGRILISEACSHSPKEEDIGRIKIPKLLRKKFGNNIEIEFSRGEDKWERGKYDLIVHCGACMLNRKMMKSRVEKAKKENLPMTNYGILIAYLTGILDKIVY